MSVKRPVLRWHGGKWKLAPWVIENFPEHRVYVEPFGGAASVLLRKPRSYAEVYNDLDESVVELFRVLRDRDLAAQLREALRLTPFARKELEMAYGQTGCAVERARRLIVRSYQCFGSDAHNPSNRSGFRSNSNRSGTTPAHDWMNYPDKLDQATDRLQGVIIECRPALQVMRDHDGPDVLHYLDPPYLGETRSQKSRKGGQRYHAYVHEMTDDDHREMLDAIDGLQGMVVLSGYPSELYSERLAGWTRIEKAAHADGARDRTEVLWLNPTAAAHQPQPTFLEVA